MQTLYKTMHSFREVEGNVPCKGFIRKDGETVMMKKIQSMGRDLLDKYLRRSCETLTWDWSNSAVS